MDIFAFCIEIVIREGVKFKVGIDSLAAKEITAATANDINYDIVYNRSAYLFRCGAVNISFASESFCSFILKYYYDVDSLLFKWNNCPDLTLCSITKGPALDYIAFLLSWHRYLPMNSLPLFKNINIISKFGAWRNTVNIMQQVINDGQFKPLSGVPLGNIEVIQGDPIQNVSEKVKEPIRDSDVIMMIKSIKFQDDVEDQKKVSNSLMEIFDALKPGAILLCIDTKPVTALIMQVLSKFPGKYLFDPTQMNTKLDFDCPDSYKTEFGCTPVISARGVFFVWEKSSVVLPANMLFYKSPELHENMTLECGNKSNENTICTKSSSEVCSEKMLAQDLNVDYILHYQHPEYYIYPGSSKANSISTYESNKDNSHLTEQINTSTQVLLSSIPPPAEISQFDSNLKETIESNCNLIKTDPYRISPISSISKDNSSHCTGMGNISIENLSSSMPLKNEIPNFDSTSKETNKTCKKGSSDIYNDSVIGNAISSNPGFNKILHLAECVNNSSQTIPSRILPQDDLSYLVPTVKDSITCDSNPQNTHITNSSSYGNSTPTVLDSKYNLHLKKDNISGSSTQVLPPLSSKSKVPILNFTGKESNKTYVEKKNNLVPVNESLQTEMKHSDQKYLSKIDTLTNQVTKLTQVINTMLQTSTCEDHVSVFKQREKSVAENYRSNSCLPDCTYHSPGLTESSCVGNCNRRNSCQQHICSRQNSCCDSLCRSSCHALRFCSCACCGESSLSRKGFHTTESPNIVIPLNSLPRDVVSQIIWCLSSKIKND